MPRTLKRYGPVSTRARAAGLEIQEDGDFLLREDVVRMFKRRIRTEEARYKRGEYDNDPDRAEGAITALEALLARLGEKP